MWWVQYYTLQFAIVVLRKAVLVLKVNQAFFKYSTGY